MKSNYYNTANHCSRRGYINRPATTAATALGFALLFSAATPCVGRTTYRGRAMTPRTSLRGARVEYGTSRRVRRLQIEDQTEGVTTPPTALETRATPTCTRISVPTIAGNLTGIYTHMGRYNHKRPVYINQANGNHLFAQTASENTTNTSSTSWYLTQSDTSFNFFLSIESDVLEPIDMNGVQPWVRNNDAACSNVGTCFTWMLLNCETLTTELFSTPAPSDATDSPFLHSSAMGGNASEYSDSDGTEITSTPTASGEEAYYLADHATSALGSFSASPTPSPTVPEDLIPTTDATTTSTSSTFATDTSFTPAVGGCVTLDVSQGGARTGVYLLKSPDYSNSLPGYVISGYRQDEVFSVQMSVCAPDWGVVNATWAAATGELPATASVRDVWLMYAAGLSLEDEDSSGSSGGGGGCMVDVWLITGGGVLNLGEAEEVTFLAVSDADDPSEAIRWAKFTPATTAERATLEDNSWIQVDCAGSDESDFDTTATPTPSPLLATTPVYVPESAAVGEEPQGRGG